MTKFVLINNTLTKENEATISINQRACLFGDGIFETCRITNGIIYNFKAHKARIKAGLSALKFSAAIDELEKQSYKLIKKNNIKNGILRISISRGIGSKGYLPTYKSKSLTIIQTSQIRKRAKGHIKLGIGSSKKPSGDALPIACKTMQALPYTLNKIEAQERELFDCIMLSQNNYISETSAANIFWVKKGKIYTPSQACDILLGTIRQKIVDNFEVKKVEAKVSELKKADEIFLTNVSGLVLAVDEVVIDGKNYYFEGECAKKILGWMESDVLGYSI